MLVDPTWLEELPPPFEDKLAEEPGLLELLGFVVPPELADEVPLLERALMALLAGVPTLSPPVRVQALRRKATAIVALVKWFVRIGNPS